MVRHYWEERNFGSSREFGLEPHHSFDLETDVMCLLDKAGSLRLQLVAEEDDKSTSELAAFVPDLLMETRHSVKVCIPASPEPRRRSARPPQVIIGCQ
jgi:hypothetical protein